MLLSPTAPTTAFKFGEKLDDPVAMYLNDVATIPVNLTGNCAMQFADRAWHRKMAYRLGCRSWPHRWPMIGSTTLVPPWSRRSSTSGATT